MPTSSTRPAYLEVDAHNGNTSNSNGIIYSPPATDGAGPSTMLANLPSPTSPSWKSLFRLKPGRSKSTLTLNTEFSAGSTAVSTSEYGLASADPSVTSTLYAQTPPATGTSIADVEAGYVVHAGVMSATLTPSSSVSFGTSLGNRYSSNSTGTLSSESGVGITASLSGQRQNQSQIVQLNIQNGSVVSNGQAHSYFPNGSMRGRRSSRPQTQPSTPAQPQQSTNGIAPAMLPTPSSSSGRERTKSRASKSDKHRGLGIGQPSAPHTPVTSTSPSPAPGLTSPRTPSRGGMGRFLRRVASAPNAKGFFNLSKGHKGRDENGTAMSPGTRTPKAFGLLSPSASMTGRSSPVPEVPPVPSNVNGATSGQRGSEHGTDSLDTSSSGSSRNRNLYPNPHSYGPGSSPPPSFHPPGGVIPQTPTLAHSQSVQHLHSPQHVNGSLLSPPKGTRSTRALSAVSGPAPFAATKGKGKEQDSRIGLLSTTPVPVGSGTDGQGRAPFRRTYSSNSIKVRSIEVGPSSFTKIKLLGRGDVGKVYLVREKKTQKLFAMKGAFCCYLFFSSFAYRSRAD